MGLDRRCLRAKSLLSFEVSFKAVLLSGCCSMWTLSCSVMGTLHTLPTFAYRQTASTPLCPALLTQLEQAVGSEEV